MIIFKGDQYAIPFKIRIGSTIITPENVNDVRIQIACDLRTLSDESLTFNTEKQTWDYYLTEKVTRALSKGSVTYQVGIKMGDEIRYSSAKQLRVDDNIIKAVWSE